MNDTTRQIENTQPDKVFADYILGGSANRLVSVFRTLNLLFVLWELSAVIVNLRI